MKRFIPLFLIFLLLSCEYPFDIIELNSLQKQTIQSAVDNFNQADMNTYMTDFYNTRYSNVRYSSGRLSYMVDTGTALGLDVSLEEYDFDGYSGTNVIMLKGGTDTSLAPVYVTAHWDIGSTFASTDTLSPGADDNGSGCAGVFTIADCLQGVTTERDIIFAIFDQEEKKMIGSSAHVRDMARKPAAVYNLEMIGFTSDAEIAPEAMHLFLGIPRTGDFIGVFTNSESRNLGLNYIRMMDEFVPEMTYYLAALDKNMDNNAFLQDAYRSDHSSFWDAHVPALFITDTAELRAGAPYHSEEDTLDKIDLDFMGCVVRSTIAAVLASAGVE